MREGGNAPQPGPVHGACALPLPVYGMLCVHAGLTTFFLFGQANTKPRTDAALPHMPSPIAKPRVLRGKRGRRAPGRRARCCCCWCRPGLAAHRPQLPGLPHHVDAMPRPATATVRPLAAGRRLLHRHQRGVSHLRCVRTGAARPVGVCVGGEGGGWGKRFFSGGGAQPTAATCDLSPKP